MRKLHAVARAWPPTCAPPSLMLRVFLPELFSDCRSESVLVLQAASLVLACKCRSLQLPGEAIPTCHDTRMHLALAILVHPLRSSVLRVHAHAHYMHTGPLNYSHLGEAAFDSRMCSSQTHLQPSPPSATSASSTRIIPATCTSPYTPLGVVLCLRWAVRPTSRPTLRPTSRLTSRLRSCRHPLSTPRDLAISLTT